MTIDTIEMSKYTHFFAARDTILEAFDEIEERLIEVEGGDFTVAIEDVTGLQAALDEKVDATGAETAAGSYIDGLSGTHDATTALLGNNTFGALNPAQTSGGEITAGSETELRSYSPADIVSFISQHGGGGGLTTELDANTAITVGSGTNSEHHVLTSDSAITLTLDAQATAGMESAFTKAGSGAVSIVMESGAGYWVPSDDIGGSPATAGFTITGYGYFICIRNTGGSAAEWLFVGQSSLTSAISGDLDIGGTLTVATDPVVTQTGDELVAADANNDLTINPPFWSGTETEYAGLTPSAGTIYFVKADP